MKKILKYFLIIFVLSVILLLIKILVIGVSFEGEGFGYTEESSANGVLLTARNNVLHTYNACRTLPVSKDEIEELLKSSARKYCKDMLKEDKYPPRDYWKTPVRIEKTKENFTTRSAGKDKIFGTKDDMVEVDKYDGSTFPIW